MAYPSPDQYNDAVQAPHLAFFDPVLQKGTVLANDLGIPIALGGGFAVTYAVRHGRQKYAVRCFHKEARGLNDRYAAIGSALKALPRGPFVGFDYQPEGVRVLGGVYPVVKMEWVKGDTLGYWLERHHRRKSEITRLLDRFRLLDRTLRQAGIAHGDLQNGNVLVVDSGIRLIDYDGMFVPGLDLGQGNEVGHRHFQHPRRLGEHFGPEMDRFSFIAIDLSLRALALDPGLFKRYANGENILFTSADFLDPGASALFAELRGMRALKSDVDKFARLCGAPITDLPTLEDFVGIRPPPPPPPPKPEAPPKTPNQMLLDRLNYLPGVPLPAEIQGEEPPGPLFQPPGISGRWPVHARPAGQPEEPPQWLFVAGVAAQLLWLGAKKGGEVVIEAAARQIEALPEETREALDPRTLANKGLSGLRRLLPLGGRKKP